MPGTSAPEWRSPRARFLFAVMPVATTGALGSMATLPNIPTWYEALAKPPLTPPNAVFGPVWTLLYCLMAYAAWRILSVEAEGGARRRALTAFFVQLALNAAWSWAFFGAHSPLAGLVVIALLIVAIVATMVLFGRLDRPAAWCLAPYLAWVGFASYLNLGVFLLNRA